MKINRKELLTTLQKIKPAIKDKSGIGQSDSFIFDNDLIYTRNEDMVISCVFDSKINGAVRAQKFYDLLLKIKEDIVCIEENKNELLISTEKTKAGLKFEKIESHFSFEEKDYFNLPDNFIEGIKLTIFSASNDIDKFPLNCLQIKNDLIISCDNYRLTHFKMKGEIGNEILVPVNIAKILISYEGINKYNIVNGNIVFKNDNGILFSFRELQGTFPNTESLLEIKNGVDISLNNDFSDSILRTEIIADVSDNFMKVVEIEIENNIIKCKSTSNSGWIVESNKIDYTGEKISFLINSLFFKEILKHTNQLVIDATVILFKTENFNHVIARVV